MKLKSRKSIIAKIFCMISFVSIGQSNQTVMSLNELKTEIDFENLSSIVQNGLVEFIKYYDSIYLKTRDIFKEVKVKYRFETIHDFYGDGTERDGEIHLEFVTGVGLDYQTIICLNKDGNIDRDQVFGKIIEEEWSKKINWDELNDEDWEAFYELGHRLFYTWVAYIWQEVDGHETGLKVSIINGSSTQYFSLNDFSGRGVSNYFNFIELPKRVEKHFEETLSLNEIFSRTGSRK